MHGTNLCFRHGLPATIKSMGGECRVLWKAARPAMLAWWSRTGIWLLVGLVAFYATNFLNYAFLRSYSSWGGPSSQFMLSLLLPVDLALLGVWLWAAMVCYRLLSRILEEHAAPKPASYMRASFLVAYAQGIAPLTIAFFLGAVGAVLVPYLLYGQLFPVASGPPGYPFITVVDTITSLFRQYANDSLTAAWLVGMFVLIPRQPILPWALMLTLYITERVVYFSVLLLRGEPTFAYDPQTLAWSWGWLLSVAIVLSMLYAMRHGLLKLAYACYGVLVIALVTGDVLKFTLAPGQRGIISYVVQLSFNIPRALSESPFYWWEFLNAAYERFPVNQTALGQMAHLLPLIVEPLWLAAVLALMYYVILTPRAASPFQGNTP